MIGKTNTTLSGKTETTNIEFTSELATSVQPGFDPYNYIDNPGLTSVLISYSTYSLPKGYSVKLGNIEYTNVSNSTLKIYIYSSTPFSGSYIATPKSIDTLKDVIQPALQTHIAKTNLTDAKIKIPAYFSNSIWDVYATIISGTVTVTDIKFPYTILSNFNDNPHSTIWFYSGIEIL